MAVTEQQVQDALKELVDPNTRKDYVTGKSAKNVKVEGDRVSVDVVLGYPAKSQIEPIRKEITDKLKSLPGVASANVNVTMKIVSHAVQRGVKLVPGVRNIIAVASGKGGVGKSTTSINLALALRDLGLKVGVLDADIYGPSMPKLLAIREKPQTIGGTRLKPIGRYGLAVMSIGFLLEEEPPMIWRGPMVMSALTQMLREVEWGELDVMVVDMPPGTGDAQLTMAQQVPLAGAVIVSTPQDLALIDARRGIAMFKRVNVPLLGLIENMSYFICPNCGTRSDIFGHGGARHEAERLNVPFLGEVPLDMVIRETSDSGLPVVATQPDGPHAKVYRGIAERVRDALAGAGRAAPKIVIEA